MPTMPRLLRRWTWIAGAAVLVVLLWLVASAVLGPRVPTVTAERQALVQRVIANGRVWVPARVQLGTMAAGVVAGLCKQEHEAPGKAEEYAGHSDRARRITRVDRQIVRKSSSGSCGPI